MAASLLVHGVFIFYRSAAPHPASRSNIQVSIKNKGNAAQRFHINKPAANPEKRPLPAKVPVAAPVPPVESPASPPEILAETYIDPDEVDQKAVVLEVPELPPPDGDVEPGPLRIKLFISETGTVDDIEILETTLPEPYVEILLNIIRQAQFSPAQSAGEAVPSWREIEILYGYDMTDLPENTATGK